jgi:hypothetical protein
MIFFARMHFGTVRHRSSIMRHIGTPLTLLLVGALSAQSGEFTVYPNGYIYSEASMAQLHHIVDSLNIRFRACEVDRTYRSWPHARSRHLSLSGNTVKAVVRDIEAGMSLEELQRRHSGLDLDPEVLCAFIRYTDDGEPMTTAVPISFSDRMEGRLDAPGDSFTGPGPHTGKWLLDLSEYNGTDYLEAVVITEEPQWVEFPERYGRLVQYVDCLIDTTQRIYAEDAQRSYRGEASENPATDRLRKRVEKAVSAQPPEWTGEEEDEAVYEAAYSSYEALRGRQVDSLAAQPDFQKALDEAVQATLADHVGDPFLEELVIRYGKPADALALKRNRRVWGSCSMDDSPRRHALDIATLAAESVNWDIFLRAHLDILNDRFDRASDGSYAQAGRQTYVMELEELEIAVPDLLLGTLLRAENTNAGHYVASANRTGRAITEVKEAGAIAARLLAMIADPELDLYNRAVLYYAYLNYNGHLEDEALQARNEKALEEAMAGIPKELRGKRR